MTAGAGCRLGLSRRLVVQLCLALACAATAAAADPKESFRKGILAADRGQWTDVVRYMREASAQQDKEGEPVKIYGVRIVPYLPHFYLGLALSQTGRCEEALAQWQESERQGAIKTTPHYKSLQSGRELCKQPQQARAKPAVTPTPPASPGPVVAAGPDASVLIPAVREAEGAVQKAADAGAQVARRRADPEYAEAWKAESAQGIEATATQAIVNARSNLERGKNLGRVPDLQEAARLAGRARQDLEALAGRLDQRRTELRQAKEKAAADKLAADREAADKQAREKAAAAQLAADREAAEKLAREETARREAEGRDQAERQSRLQELSGLVADARRLLGQTVAAQPRSAELDRRQARLQGILRRASAPSAAASAADLQQLREELAAAVSGLEKASAAAATQPGPPSELRAAARALFRANYGEVVQALAGASFAERRAAVTAALLLAAARYSLYLEGGEKDVKLRRQAGEDARTCRRLAPALNPDPRLFSPRFVQFFRSPG